MICIKTDLKKLPADCGKCDFQKGISDGKVSYRICELMNYVIEKTGTEKNPKYPVPE